MSYVIGKSGVHHRSSTRYDVDLPVVLRNETAGEVRARVCDFSLGGLLLRPEGADWSPLMPIAQNSEVSVSGSIQGRHGNRELSFAAIIARVAKGEIGVRFVAPDATALLSLHNYAVASHEPDALSFVAPGAAVNGLAWFSDSERNQIAEEVCNRVSSYVDHLAREGYFDAAEKEFLIAESNSPSERERRALFYSRRSLMDFRSELSGRFLSNIVNHMRQFSGPARHSLGGLIEGWSARQKEMDPNNWMAIAVLSSQAEVRFSYELLPLQLRMDRLLDISLSSRRNPLHPSFFLMAFMDALRWLAIAPLHQRIALKAFDQAVMRKLGGIYRSCNELLAQKGVMSELDAVCREMSAR